MVLQHYGSHGNVDNPAGRLAVAVDAVAAGQATLTTAQNRIIALRAEPAVRAQPPEVIEPSRSDWAADREHRDAWLAVRAAEHQHRQIEPRGRGWGGVPENSVGEPSHVVSR
jgi:hypothetical protein